MSLQGEPFADGTFFDDGTGWVDGPQSAVADIRVVVRERQDPIANPLSSWETGAGFRDRMGVQDGEWFGEPATAPPLIRGGGDAVRLDRVDDWGRVPAHPAYRLPEVTLRLYLVPLATPDYTAENQQKFLIANSVTTARGPGAFSIERKADRLAAYLHDTDNRARWFGAAPHGLPGVLLAEGELACIELIQGPGGAKLRVNGAVVARMPELVMGWQQAAAIGFIVGSWHAQAQPSILIDGLLGPIEVFPFAMPDDVLPPMAQPI